MGKRDELRENVFKSQLLLPWSPGRTISTVRAAELLGCSQTTVRSMIEDGTLKGYKIRPKVANSPYRVFRDSVEEHARQICVDLDMERSR